MLKYDRIDISKRIDVKKTKAMNFDNVAIVSNKGSEYRIHFWYMRKNDAINIIKNSNLNEKKWIIPIFFIIYRNE